MKKTLFTLLLISVLFAQCEKDVLNIVLSEQGTLISLVIIISAIGIALLYTFGKFAEKPEYIVLAKDELYHLFFSAVLLIAFGGIIFFGCLLSSTIIDFGKDNLQIKHPCLAQLNANNVALCSLISIEKEIDSIVYALTKQQLTYLQDAGWAYSAGDIIKGETKTTSMEAYKRVYASEIDILLTTYLFPARLAITMQKTAITLINDSIIQWILPIAFLFRFFPPFRSAGNILLGICLALYVLFPFFLVFNFLMYYSVFDDCHKYANIFEDKPLDKEIGSTVCTSPISMWNVARFIPIAFFLPNLAIALTITFIFAIDRALRVIG
ncbi:MAG: hypothetical protein QW255_03600 [Candidatus Bilamarchaeaceae archaeon]